MKQYIIQFVYPGSDDRYFWTAKLELPQVGRINAFLKALEAVGELEDPAIIEDEPSDFEGARDSLLDVFGDICEEGPVYDPPLELRKALDDFRR